MIDITKKYRTRDGREVTELSHYDNDSYVVSGYAGGDWVTWTATGAHWDGSKGDLDLIEVVDEQPDTELAELRAFRDAAIAKYPDLAPVDPIEAECKRIWDEGVGKATIAGLIRAALLRGIEMGRGAA